MKNFFFLAAFSLSSLALTNNCAAQEFKLSDLERYMKQSPMQVAAAFKSKKFVFEKRDDRMDIYAKGNAKAHYMLQDNNITTVGWSESIAMWPKVLADLEAANYVKKSSGQGEFLYANRATGLSIIVMKITLTKTVCVIAGRLPRT